MRERERGKDSTTSHVERNLLEARTRPVQSTSPIKSTTTSLPLLNAKISCWSLVKEPRSHCTYKLNVKCHLKADQGSCTLSQF